MADLFKKLNILLRSSVSNRGERSTPPLDRNVERDVEMLRRRINEALGYEDELKARVQALDAEVARWDSDADRAVAAGDDAAGRYAIEQMQRAQQRRTMAEADLRDHQLVTQELIQRVNMLDAAVADARHAKSDKADAPPASGLSDVLRDARDTVAGLGDTLAAKDEVAPPDAPVDNQAVEDDLESRRRRLSQ